MKEILFHNIELHIDIENMDENIIPLIEKELGINKILDNCHKYFIYIVKDKISDMEMGGLHRVYYDPLQKKAVWVNEIIGKQVEINEYFQCISEAYTYKLVVQRKDEIYSLLRTKLCEIIRKELLEQSQFALHTAVIEKNGKLNFIIGTKGSGKTSAALYAKKSGWNICTDEMCFIGENGITALQRFPALAEEALNQYFDNNLFEQVGRIHGYLNNYEKKLLGISTLQLNEEKNKEIEKIFVLTKGNCCDYTLDYKEKIVRENLLIGNDWDEKAANLVEDFIEKGIMINVKYFQDMES